MRYIASNENRWATTIGDQSFFRRFYLITDSGFVLERGDGEVRWFRTIETAQREADRLNRLEMSKSNVKGR